MNYLYILIISVLLISTINYVQYKFNFLIDLREKHKIKLINKTPLSGGIIILLYVIIIKILFNVNINGNIILILSLFFVLGYFSDTKPNFRPIIRLILQIVLIILMLYFCDLKINKTNIFFIDYFLSIKGFNILFTTFCILVFLNGSNFIDGVNTNLILYNFIIFIHLINYDFYFDISLLLIILATFGIYNFFGKCFLGDNGVYIISILTSFIVISIININNLNPFIAINLLWYPAFENLFSIIRRYINNDRVDRADKKHLHTLLFLFINKYKITSNLSNSLSGLIINLFNFISIFFSVVFINNNQILFFILIINILLYLITYLKLLNNFKSLPDSKI